MTYEGLEEFAERVINRYQKLDVKKYFLTYEEFLANVKVANRLIYNNILEVLYSFTELLEGELEVYVANKKYKLSKGDSLYFKSSLKHRFKNTSKKEVKALWVVSPPTF